VFLAVSLAGLALGSSPESLFPAHAISGDSPALPVLLAVQAGMLFLLAPFGRQAGGCCAGADAAHAFGRSILLLIVSSPMYLAAAYLSNAVAGDVLRGGLYLLMAAAGAAGLGVWASHARWPIAVVGTLAAMLVALAGPVAYYLIAEFVGRSFAPQWLWWFTPSTCAFSLGQSRHAWDLAPLWAWLVWPIIGVVLVLAGMLVRPQRTEEY
jgi:hypothetical protein